MDKNLSYFSYRPPKSNSMGHSIRDRNLRRVTSKLAEVFIKYFDAKPDEEMQVNIYYDKKDDIAVKKAQNTISKLNSFLGGPLREWDNPGYEHSENSVTWETKEKDIFSLLDFIESYKSDDVLDISKYWISTFYHYGTIGKPHGHMMFSIKSGRLFVRTRLILPFTIDDQRVYEFICSLVRELPFKLNSKHFRRLGPSKRGYGTWKLNDDELNRINECFSKPSCMN